MEGYTINNLSIGYGKTVVADDLNATLKAGTMTCLLGPNGAGKSTLLRTLCAFQPPLGGELLMDGRNIDSLQPSELSQMIGVVLTERVNVQGMTVRELIAMGRAPYTNFWGKLEEHDNQIIDEAIELTGINDLVPRQLSTLSDGERQKVMIAKALAQQTPIILLDEPTAFLDFPSKVDTMLLLSRLAHEKHKAILISTHDLDLALQTADSLWLMGRNEELSVPQDAKHKAKSRLVVGSPKQLADDGSLATFFASPRVFFDAEQLRFLPRK